MVTKIAYVFAELEQSIEQVLAFWCGYLATVEVELDAAEAEA